MDANLVSESDPILYTKCKEWDFSNPEYSSEDIIKCMTKVMYDAGGMGLSANQIGINTRLFIMEDRPGEIIPFFNPVVEQASDELIAIGEGCLSFPALELSIKRPKWVSVSYQTTHGVIQYEILTDTKARCFQHELDHLNGITFTKRVSKLSFDMANKKRQKRIR